MYQRLMWATIIDKAMCIRHCVGLPLSLKIKRSSKQMTQWTPGMMAQHGAVVQALQNDF